jgi:hypothetical protein
MSGGDTDKATKPAPPPLISSTPLMPAVDATPIMQSHPGGNSLAALGAAPMPVAMFGSPIPWSSLLDPNAPQMSMMRAPNVGTFVLDPSIADQSSPDGLDVHVLVESALPGAEPVHYVVLERPVRAAVRLAVFAISIQDVYDSAMEAFATQPMFAQRATLPEIIPGQQYWTSAGAIIALGSSGDAVFTAGPNRDTGAAGAVILLNTDSGTVMIDAGMQTPDQRLAAAVGDELGREIASYLGTADLGEAILSRKPPDGHVTPYVGKLVRIRTLRGTLEQYQDGSIGEVLAVQREYRTWYLQALREKLIAERATWEGSQPIVPNNSIREQRWQQHLESAIAAATRDATPPALAIASDAGAFVQMRDEVPPVEASITRDATGAVDLTDMDWEPADDETFVAVAGNNLGVFSAKGMLYRPATVPPAAKAPTPAPPSSRSVPELKAKGPHGPAMPAPRAVTAWAVMGAVGKEGSMLVRIKAGHAVLVDAGGAPRAITLEGLAAAQTEMAVKIDKILLTHPHTDHVKHILDLIKGDAKLGLPPIRAENVVFSRAWKDIGKLGEAVKVLKATKDPALLELGYGKEWNPGIAVEGKGTIKLTTTVEGTAIDIYARPEAHKRLVESRKEAARDKAAGKRKGDTVGSNKYDSASFMYVIGNESSPNRMAILGDLRGADILAMQADLNAAAKDGFNAAFKDVRVVQGLGHHLSKAAGQTEEDVAGLDALLDATLHQNGELTVMVQSTEMHSFRGELTMEGPRGALLHYLRRQGVHVVFAGQAEDGEPPSAAHLDSDLHVRTTGTGVRIFDPTEPRIVEMWDRIKLLREAQRTVQNSPDHGAEALGMKDRNSYELDKALQSEIKALEQIARDYRDLSGADLLALRGEKGELDRYQKPSKTEQEIFDALGKKGDVETKLTPEVVAKLRAAIASGKPISLYVQFGAVPRDLLDELDEIPEDQLSTEQKDALAKKYRELSELTSKLDGVTVPEKDRLAILARAEQLRAELQNTLKNVGEHEHLKAELARMDAAIQKLKAETQTVGEKVGRDARGRFTRTKYIKVKEFVHEGAELLGKGMGALMVVHSIQELGTALDQAGKQDVNAPQVALELTHSAYGIDMGIRMVRGMHVGGGEFAMMSVIEIGIAAAGNYETERERQEAINQAVLSGAANLGCMALGEGVMEVSAFLPPPFDLIGFGLGLAITFAGDWVLDLFGLKHHDYLQELAQEIDPALDEYKALIGSQELGARSPDELATLGIDPKSFKWFVDVSAERHLSKAHDKERDITKLFEKAYADAKKSAKGLEYLDAKAAEFLRLRGQAMQGMPDPQRGELEARWRAMDAKVTFSPSVKVDDPWDLDQWHDLFDKTEKIRELLKESDADVDREKLEHELSAAEEMLENARYRVESASRGGMRPDPILKEPLGFRYLYLDQLGVYETMISEFHQRLVRLTTSKDEKELGFDNYGMKPAEAYHRLKIIRADYDARVQQAAAIMPELAKPETWAKPAELARAVVAENTDRAGTFHQLKILELSLQIATHQASSSLVINEYDADDTLRKMIEDEVKAANLAIEARRYTYGLIFRDELESIMTAHAADTDKELGAALDAAYSKRIQDPTGAKNVRAFSDNELQALHTGHFDQDTERLSSTSAQLARLRKELGEYVRDKGHDRLVSLAVERKYFIVSNPFTRLDVDSLDREKHDYTPGMNPVVLQPAEQVFPAFSGEYYWVFAVNEDAISVLGPDPVAISRWNLTEINEDGILEAARKKKPQ